MSIMSSWLMVFLNSTMSLLIFCMLDMSDSFGGFLESPTLIVDSPISPYSSLSFCLTWFDALLLGTYMLGIVMCSWKRDHFIITYIISLFLITLTWTSSLSEINRVTPTFLCLVLMWYIFIHPFTFRFYLSLI